MSAEAVSIGVNLFVQNAFAWQYPDETDKFATYYYKLRGFAADYKEGAKIMRFID